MHRINAANISQDCKKSNTRKSKFLFLITIFLFFIIQECIKKFLCIIKKIEN